MRRADERRSASMMISSSIRWSLAGYEVDCTTKTVGAAHVFLDLDEDFHVGEAPHHGFGQRGFEIVANLLRERWIGIAGDQLDRTVFTRHSNALIAAGPAAAWS